MDCTSRAAVQEWRLEWYAALWPQAKGASLEYDKTEIFSGNASVVLSSLRDAFLQQGFELLAHDEHSFQVRGGGMTSTKQSPLLGVSKAEVVVAASDVTLRAELGGVRRMQYFVMLFPPALVLGLCVMFYFTLPNWQLFVRNSAPAMVLQWLVIGVFMAWWIRRRTVRALDVTLKNAIELSRTL